MRDVLSASRAGLSAGRGKKKNKEMNDERNEDFSRGESDEWPQSERSQHNVEISNFIKVASPAACCHRRRYRHSASLYYHASADKVENKCVMHYSSNNSNNTNNSSVEKKNKISASLRSPSLHFICPPAEVSLSAAVTGGRHQMALRVVPLSPGVDREELVVEKQPRRQTLASSQLSCCSQATSVFSVEVPTRGRRS